MLPEPRPGLSPSQLTAAGLVLASGTIATAITALPVGDALPWLVALELKPVTLPNLGGHGGSSNIG